MTMTSTEARDFYLERFGSFYSPESASKHIGMSIHELNARIEDNYILAPMTSDGKVVIPELQFINGFYSVSIALLLTTLSGANGDLDEWSKLYLITLPLEEFQGRNAIEIIRGGDLEEVKELHHILGVLV